jgi:hypothetical protein
MKKLFLLCLLLPLYAADKPRVYVTDRDGYRESGTAVVTNGTGAAHFSGGTRRMSTEQVKTLAKNCSSVMITADQSKANYVVVWDNRPQEDLKWGQRANEYTVYNGEGDLVGSGSTHRLSTAAKEICALVK